MEIYLFSMSVDSSVVLASGAQHLSYRNIFQNVPLLLLEVASLVV